MMKATSTFTLGLGPAVSSPGRIPFESLFRLARALAVRRGPTSSLSSGCP